MTSATLTYAEFVMERDALENEIKAAGVTLRGFDNGSAGLTPDTVKALPEWRAAKAKFNAAMNGLQNLNRAHLARFKTEENARRAARFG